MGLAAQRSLISSWPGDELFARAHGASRGARASTSLPVPVAKNIVNGDAIALGEGAKQLFGAGGEGRLHG